MRLNLVSVKPGQAHPSSGLNVGLMAYGHRRTEDCGDIQLLTEVRPLDREDLTRKIESLTPTGRTPMTAAITEAVRELEGSPGSHTVVLISDGRETCDPDRDLCEVIRALRGQHDFELVVVGFDIVDEAVARQLTCLADAGGGRYIAAATGTGLDLAVGVATGTEDPDVVLPAAVHENIQLILDRSELMRLPFTDSGRTRLEAATSMVRDALGRRIADRDNLAFRHFGGNCGEMEDNSRLAVGWGTNNSGSIEVEMGRLGPAGQATLVDAILKATTDFRSSRFDGMNKRVIIVAGEVDLCPGSGEDLIRQRLQQEGISPEFRFIGVSVPPDVENRYHGIVAATNGLIVFVDTEEELRNALELFFDFEPAAGDIDAVVLSLNDGITILQEGLDEVAAGRYPSAQELLLQVPDAMARAAKPYEDLSRRRQPAEYAELFEAISNLRRVQVEMIQLAEVMIDSHRSEQVDRYNDANRGYSESSNAYNEAVEIANQILTSLRTRYESLDVHGYR